MIAPLLHLTMADGSRHFLSIPADCSSTVLREHVASLSGAVITDVLDSAIELWLDFHFHDHRFTINDQFGEFWFFVSDPRCPDDILLLVADHFTSAA